MAVELPGNFLQHDISFNAMIMHVLEEKPAVTRMWYFSREEIEDHSPSRKDGIDLEKESNLRRLYCTFLQELGMNLKVPQVTIATAMMLCHRFYMRQSHAKNDWQTVATACMFLACKSEDTPRWLNDLIVMSYTLIYKWDPSAPQRIKKKEIYEKQKELIVTGERLLLATVAFDLNIEHPYKSLVTALKKLDIPHNKIVKVAWNFVNDWLRTTLCLQYKPHYIAAGSIFLASKFLKVKLPSINGHAWWMQFDVSPKVLEDVIQQMYGSLEQNRKQAKPSQGKKEVPQSVNGKETSVSPESCISSGSVIARDSTKTAQANPDTPTKPVNGLANPATYKSSQEQGCIVHDTPTKPSICQTSDSSSGNSIVENHGRKPVEESIQKASYSIVPVNSGHVKMDLSRIREKLKKRKGGVVVRKPETVADDEIDGEAWIERELERGLEHEGAVAEKRQRL